MSKACTGCGEDKSLEDYNRDKSGTRHGRSARCRACVRAYRKANREKIAEYGRAYREANRKKIAERSRAYREANLEKERERDRAYHAANREKRAEKDRAYYAANREKLAEYDRAYYAANREKIAEKARAYAKAHSEEIAERNRAYREANREKIAEYSLAYDEANREYRRAANARRKSLPGGDAHGRPWLAGEDALVMDPGERPSVSIAAILGRSEYAVCARRLKLKKELTATSRAK